MRPARLLALSLGGVAAALAFAGLTAAQDAVAPPPSAPPADPIAAQPPVQGQAAAVPLPSEAAPPEESAPSEPEPLNQAVEIEPEPAPPPAPPTPQKRPRYTAAVLQAIDKVTAETLRFEAKVNEPVRYKGLVLTVHACETTTPQEGYSDAMVHLEVQSEPESVNSRAANRIAYRGWMSSASPGLHPFEHPVYDVWLIACRTAAPSA